MRERRNLGMKVKEKMQLMHRNNKWSKNYICSAFFMYIYLKKRIEVKNMMMKRKKKLAFPVLLFIMVMLITVMLTGSNIHNLYYNDSMRNEPIHNNKVFQNINIGASNVCMINATTEQEIFSINKDEKIAPASTAKMLTALTTIAYCEPGEEVTVGEEIKLIAADASRAYLREGNKLTIKQLLEGLLLPSGNDAAYVLAVYTGRKIAKNIELPVNDAVTVFVDKMNENAIVFGADNSNFLRPDGYDVTGQYTTAYDLACIALNFIKSDYSDYILSDIVKETSVRECFSDGTDVTWRNTNELINPASKFYYKDAVGLKTGSSDEAGKCLVSAAYFNNSLYIAVVMGDTEEGRFQDSIKLFDVLK